VYLAVFTQFIPIFTNVLTCVKTKYQTSEALFPERARKNIYYDKKNFDELAASTFWGFLHVKID